MTELVKIRHRSTTMRKSRGGGNIAIKGIIVIVTVSLILLQLVLAKKHATFRSSSSPISHHGSGKIVHEEEPTTLLHYFTAKEAETNAAKVQASREALSCEEATSIFMAPDEKPTGIARRYPKRCQFAFLDLGANVGDSLGKLVDAGLPPSCANGETFRFTGCNGVQRQGSESSTRKLTDWVVSAMTQFQRTHGNRRGKPQPELYCYVGVEGNPRFRQELQDLQQCVMQTVPRPLRSVHMYTDTVASGDGDGPTILYLDTINSKNNFFGSSLLATHTDVRNSARNGAAETANVNGVTLSSLLKETVSFGAGSHVMIKIDIEGAEYKLLNEAYDSNVLCDCAQHGVRVDLRVEIHPKVG